MICRYYRASVPAASIDMSCIFSLICYIVLHLNEESPTNRLKCLRKAPSKLSFRRISRRITITGAGRERSRSRKTARKLRAMRRRTHPRAGHIPPPRETSERTRNALPARKNPERGISPASGCRSIGSIISSTRGTLRPAPSACRTACRRAGRASPDPSAARRTGPGRATGRRRPSSSCPGRCASR